MDMTPSTLAAIDVGTNSFHLVVVRVVGNRQFTVVNREKVVVRLGESGGEFKRLGAEAIGRGIEAMRLLGLVAKQTDSPIRAVATSAVREAENGEEFVRAVREETGIEIEVISGFEEARLIYLGVLQALPLYKERIALVDIGGGSTEFLLGERGRSLYANSYKIGAIRMTERFFPDERISSEQVASCRLYLRGEILHAAQQIRQGGYSTLVASSGTAETIAAMALARRDGGGSAEMNGVEVTREEVDAVTELVLGARTHAARSKIPGGEPRRADIIAAGCVVMQTVLDSIGADRFTISGFALREGIVLDTIQKVQEVSGVAHLSDLRFETVMKIGRMYNFDEAHARHVADLSLSIFDPLQNLHDLEEDARELLEAAALLHDVGYYISHSSHHKHSLYLIRHSEALGFNNDEIAIVANVARYHRKSHPKNRHPDFAELRKQDQQTVRVLAAILRVADGLDRTHDGRVESIDLQQSEDEITLRVCCRTGSAPTFEIWSVNRKKELMEEVFGRHVEVLVEEPQEA